MHSCWCSRRRILPGWLSMALKQQSCFSSWCYLMWVMRAISALPLGLNWLVFLCTCGVDLPWILPKSPFLPLQTPNMDELGDHGISWKGNASRARRKHVWLWRCRESRPLFFFFFKEQAKSLHTRMFEVCFICRLPVFHIIKKENPDFIQDQTLHSSLSHNSYLKSD